MTYAYRFPQERPELRALYYVSPREFGPAHLALIERMCEHSWDGALAPQVCLAIAHGTVWLWGVRSGDDTVDDAIVLLSVEQRPNGVTCLNVYGVAGDGIIAKAAELHDDIRTIATFYGLTRVTATTTREGFEPLAKLWGWTEAAVTWEKDLTDGQQHAENHDDHTEG